MIHGVVTLGYFIYTMITGRFVYLPFVLLLFQIPYVITLVLLCLCTSVSLLASSFIPRRDLRTTVWDGPVGMPGLDEDFYAWLFKWGVIALTSVQDATLLIENEALQMPRTTSVEFTEEQDLEEDLAIRNGIGFRREWIRTGAMHKVRESGIPTRTENFKNSLYYLRATFRTYAALLVRHLRGEDTRLPRTPMRAQTPFSGRAQTPYDEEEDEDYVFSDRDTSPSLSEDEECEDEAVTEGTSRAYRRATTPNLISQSRDVPVKFRRESSPFNHEFRESSPFLRETRPFPESSRIRETTPFDTLEPNPPSSFDAAPPSVADFSDEDADDNPLTELLPDIASTLSSFARQSTETESEDSQLLFSHLASERIMTRARYRQDTESQRLETLIQYRRRPRRGSNATDEVYEIQRCVVCKTNPRVIVLWPCRYLWPLRSLSSFTSLLCWVPNAVDALRCVMSVDRYWLSEISVSVLVVERK